MGDFKSGGFEAWLSKMLMSLNSDIDLEVYVSYIVGILESEATDGARDSLSSILSGIIGGVCQNLRFYGVFTLVLKQNCFVGI